MTLFGSTATKTATYQLWRCKASAAGPHWAVMEGKIYRAVNGELPAVLAALCEPFTSTDLPEGTVTIDVPQFAAAEENAQRRAETPIAPQPLTEADVRRRFHWTRDDLRLAIAFVGFPAGELVVAGGWHDTRHERRWLEHDVERWLTTGRTLGLDRIFKA
jgi:hypothetical protein